jgi:hypothetical protein
MKITSNSIRDYHKVLILLVLGFAMIVTSSNQVFAWKPNQHVGMGYLVLADLAADGKVTIRGTDYTVSGLIAGAILNYPTYYLMGTIGPDAYPDMYFGQSFIHPDTKSEGGSNTSWSDEWLEHLLKCAADNYPYDNGKALAFAYGFISHAVGDMWCHTFVNKYAGGAWPPLGPDMRVAARHMVIESYVNHKTRPYLQDLGDISQYLGDSAFHDFIYSAFIDNAWARQHSSSVLFDFFLGMKDELEDSLKEWDKDWWDRAWWATPPIGWVVKPYIENWIEDIEDGLKAWPVVSSYVAYNLFKVDDTAAAQAVLEDWAVNHFLSMIGLPDAVGDVIDAVGDLIDLITELFKNAPGLKQVWEFFAELKEDIVDWIFEQAFDVTLTELKSMFKDPQKWLDGEIEFRGQNLFDSAPFGSQTREELDQQLAYSFSGSGFDPYKFDATYNTIMISNLLLLDGAGLNMLLGDLGTGPLYNTIAATLPGDLKEEGMCAALGFMKSLDGNHQWMPEAPDGESWGTGGMHMWDNIDAQERAFKKIFHLGLDMDMTQTLDIVPGDTGIFDIDIINTENVPDTFGLEVNGLPSSWSFYLSANSVFATPGTDEPITLEIVPFRDCTTLPGDYDFTLNGASTSSWYEYDLVPTKVEFGTVHVMPFYQPHVTITPESQSTKPGGSRDYTVELKNEGNVQDSYSISLTYIDFGDQFYAWPTQIQESWVSIGTTAMSLMNCASQTTTLRITIPSDWAGMDFTTYEAKVTGTSNTDSSAMDDDSAFIVVEPTKESKTRYLDLELEWLKAMVNSSTIEPDVKASLIEHLTEAIKKKEQALGYLLKGKEKLTNNMLGACKNIVMAFINLVEAQDSKSIPIATASEWIGKSQILVGHIEDTITTPDATI